MNEAEPEELWNLTFAEANAWRDRFAAIPFEDKGGSFQPRYFQDIAISRALEAIAPWAARAHRPPLLRLPEISLRKSRLIQSGTRLLRHKLRGLPSPRVFSATSPGRRGAGLYYSVFTLTQRVRLVLHQNCAIFAPVIRCSSATYRAYLGFLDLTRMLAWNYE